MSQEKRLFLLDAYALIFVRISHSFGIRGSLQGHGHLCCLWFCPGFARSSGKGNPTHVAVVFDTSAPTKRHEEYPEYKANRDETPEAIKIATPLIKKMLEGFGIPGSGQSR